VAKTLKDGDLSGGRVSSDGLSVSQVAVLRKTLTAAVSRICPTWLSQEREDLVQTSLLSIVRTLGRGQPGEPVREANATYLWKTAYSVTLDEIRRARWRFERSAPDGPPDGGRTELGPDPERAASSREIGLHVRACLRGLEDSRRRAVAMRLAGYDNQETAERLGMGSKQVANFVHRGMQDLRRCLREKGVTA
jgi:RNA polymerase sigma factor (sigma-70 family)